MPTSSPTRPAAPAGSPGTAEGPVGARLVPSCSACGGTEEGACDCWWLRESDDAYMSIETPYMDSIFGYQFSGTPRTLSASCRGPT